MFEPRIIPFRHAFSTFNYTQWLNYTQRRERGGDARGLGRFKFYRIPHTTDMQFS